MQCGECLPELPNDLLQNSRPGMMGPTLLLLLVGYASEPGHK